MYCPDPKNPLGPNADCIGPGNTDRCCIASGPDSTKGDCWDKGVYTANQKWLCDPGIWMVCDETTLNTKQSFNGKTYSCVLEKEEFKWAESSNNESRVSVIDLIINFFSRLFKFN